MYGITIGETAKDEANNILLKKRGFFYPNGYQYINKAQRIDMSWGEDEKINYIKIEIYFNFPKFFYKLLGELNYHLMILRILWL